MSGVETFGGKCPQCSQKMVQKWNSNYSGFMFDACPFCGFAFAACDNDGEERGSAVFEYLMTAYSFISVEQWRNRWNLERISATSIETVDRGQFNPSVFDYSKMVSKRILAHCWNIPCHEEACEILKEAYDKRMLVLDLNALTPKNSCRCSSDILEKDGVENNYHMTYHVRFANEVCGHAEKPLATLPFFNIEEAFAVGKQSERFTYSEAVIRLAMGLDTLPKFSQMVYLGEILEDSKNDCPWCFFDELKFKKGKRIIDSISGLPICADCVEKYNLIQLVAK